MQVSPLAARIAQVLYRHIHHAEGTRGYQATDARVHIIVKNFL